jgi:hypothetical protein
VRWPVYINNPVESHLTNLSNNMKRSLRQVLVDSHIAAVTIAVLLLWTIDGAFRALWGPVSRVVGFLFTAVAILDIPYFSPTLTLADRFMLITASVYLYTAAVTFSAAWLLSRWVYGVGPVRSLTRYCKNLTGGEHA